jgi:hypothetical protein
VATVVSVLLAAGAFTTQEPQSVTVAGCLRAGSANGVFVLRGAQNQAAAQAPRDYLLVQTPDGIAELVNRQVAVAGTVHPPDSGPPPPEGANSAERALRRLAVQSLTEAAPNCGE